MSRMTLYIGDLKQPLPDTPKIDGRRTKVIGQACTENKSFLFSYHGNGQFTVNLEVSFTESFLNPVIHEATLTLMEAGRLALNGRLVALWGYFPGLGWIDPQGVK